VKGYRGQEQKTIGEKPGKGNSGAKMVSKGYSDKKVNQGNNKNTKKNSGQGGGKGKKK
jgi:hypothetical protein